MKRVWLWFCGALLASSGWSVWAGSKPVDESVKQIWQLLDYVSVDYAGAVSNGAVLQPSEYGEMREFSAAAFKGLRDLPDAPRKPELVSGAEALVSAVERKAAPSEVAAIARRVADGLLSAYPIAVAPTTLPDLRRGATVFAENCSSCHGATGAGDGPLAARLDPPPIAFTDAERASARSLLGLYQAVSRGVAGTGMPAFDRLSDDDRWAVTFFVGGLANDAQAKAAGEKRWSAERGLHVRFADLTALTRASETSLVPELGTTAAREVLAYLRSNPGAIASTRPGSLDLARKRLNESVAAHRSGDRANATRLALSAYLDGFEPVEPALAARNKSLLTRVESAMLTYRAALASRDEEAVASRAREVGVLLDYAEAELDPAKASSTTAFVGALTILLREGLEALLVVVGMIAFLRKAQRPDVIRHIHVGWIGALAAGGLTWIAATYLVSISGAGRELTEGVSSVFAAVVLLGVGLWMHQKSAAGRWQAYLRDKMSGAMSRRSSYAMAALAFVAVYREVFETVLFFSALWTQGNGLALILGLLAGAFVLGAIAWVLLKTSARMPIGKFFSYSSMLVAVLAVVLVGKGVKGLQEAGVLDAYPLSFPRIDMLGVFPTAETLSVQLLVASIALLGFWLNARGGARAKAIASA